MCDDAESIRVEQNGKSLDLQILESTILSFDIGEDSISIDDVQVTVAKWESAEVSIKPLSGTVGATFTSLVGNVTGEISIEYQYNVILHCIDKEIKKVASFGCGGGGGNAGAYYHRVGGGSRVRDIMSFMY